MRLIDWMVVDGVNGCDWQSEWMWLSEWRRLSEQRRLTKWINLNVSVNEWEWWSKWMRLTEWMVANDRVNRWDWQSEWRNVYDRVNGYEWPNISPDADKEPIRCESRGSIDDSCDGFWNWWKTARVTFCAVSAVKLSAVARGFSPSSPWGGGDRRLAPAQDGTGTDFLSLPFAVSFVTTPTAPREEWEEAGDVSTGWLWVSDESRDDCRINAGLWTADETQMIKDHIQTAVI